MEGYKLDTSAEIKNISLFYALYLNFSKSLQNLTGSLIMVGIFFIN